MLHGPDVNSTVNPFAIRHSPFTIHYSPLTIPRRPLNTAPVTTDPHQPLRDDVRLLGEVLGETLRRAGERGALSDGRAGARAGEGGPRGQRVRLRRADRRARAMPVEAALPVARAFSHFLTLANIAEQHHRIRRRRVYSATPTAPPQLGSCDETFGRLRAAGIGPDALHAAVIGLHIELVLTAHPTEVTRRTLHAEAPRDRRVAGAARSADLTDPERQEILDALRREVPRRGRRRDPARAAVAARRGALAAWWCSSRRSGTRCRATSACSTRRCEHTGRGLPLEPAPHHLRLVDRRRPRRQPRRHREPSRGRRACCRGGGGGPLPARDGRAALRALDDRRERRAAARAVPEAREPYRSLLRGVRDRLEATRRAIGRELARRRARPRGDAVHRARRRARRAAAPVPPTRSSSRRRPHRERPAARPAAARRGVRPDARAPRPPAARRPRTPTRSTPSRAQLGLGAYEAWSEATARRSSCAELQTPRPLVRPDLAASPEVREVLETFRAASAPAARRARRVRDLDGARARRTCSPWSCCRRKRGAPPAARRAALRDDRRPAARRRRHRDLLALPRYRERMGGPAGGDDRLLRLGEGRRPPRRQLGALHRAGGHRRASAAIAAWR